MNLSSAFLFLPLAGKGTTNDGNTARRFFRNYKQSAEITGLDEELLKRFYILLAAINSGREINVHKFEEYALQTAKLYKELYSWYYMPAHVHKLLLHGGHIIKNLLLPIGKKKFILYS